jgi:PKD repeat protein
MYKRIFRCALALLALAGATALAEQRQNIFYSTDDEHEELIATPEASSGSCGVERWSVKTGTDADVGLINLSSTSANTIVTMRSWTAPNPIPPNNRVSPYETTDWVINATLLQYKLETDSDYHLVIQDASGNTMIAEIPDPACVNSSSPFASKIQAARAAFDAKYNATTSFQTANIPVQLTGVGMFDFLHGQTGVAPNGIELHPVLNIVFNPGNGNPDFSLSAAPGSLSENQGASASTTISVTSSSGFTGNVGFTASGLPSGVSASFSPTSSSSSTTLTLTASSTAITGAATITVTGTSGSLIHTALVNLTVNPASGGGGQTAVYNSTLKAPGCATVGSGCDSGPSLLLGRASLSSGAEPNQPNTINNSCADGTSGTFHSSESNDRLAIATTDGSPLAAGKTAKVTATVWAYSTADALDLYSAANANSPSWVLLSTITPSAAGAQVLSTSFTLPAGNLQAIRANFRYQGSASPCSTGAYDDHDDLIFAVGGTTPDFGIGTSSASASITQGSSTIDTITITPQNGFTGSVALSASGLPTGVTASFSPSSTTGSSTLTFTASSTATTGTKAVTITGTSGSLSHSTTLNLTVNPSSSSIPHYDHVVIVIEENTSQSTVIGNSAAPYINSLAVAGANFTQSFAITHPSQPNYLALFSGSTQGTTDDTCPQSFAANNLGNQLITAGFTFAGYSETMPSNGYTGCTSGTSGYARKHNPWSDFTDLAASTNLMYTSFPTDFTTLPTLSFVIPNLCDDMHDCSLTTGDTWLKNNLDAYVTWAKTHNSLLIVTWDEDDSTTTANQVATIFVGANVKTGNYSETINHYSVLRTLENMYGLAALGSAATATPITDVWGTATPDFAMSASPTAVNVTQGTAVTDTITIAPSNGFTGSVALSASGLPSGVTASFSPSSTTGTSTLTLTASSTATTGTSTVTITGTSGSLTHTTTLSLTVNPAATPDFSTAAAPSSLTLTQGTNGSDTVTITSISGFNAAVNLTVSGLPSGVTAAFAPSTVTPAANGSANSTLTLTASASATTGTTAVTITGTSGSLTHSTTMSLIVNTSGGTPTANFTFATSGLAVTFTDTSTDSGGAISAHSWTFGDGGTSTATSPSHTYTAAGTYSVTETVTDSVNGHTSSKTSSVTVSGGGNVLSNGVAVAVPSTATGATVSYTMVVPAGASNLTFNMSGGTGDADMYVKFGSAPTLTTYDCRPYVTGNTELCSFAAPQAGTYYIMINAYAAFSGVSLTGSYSTGGGGGGGVLTNGVPVTGLSGSTGTLSAAYTLTVPAGKTSVTISISGGTGDADMYVKLGAAPTTTTYDCRPYVVGNSETCTFTPPAGGGTYYVKLNAYATYSGVSLVGSYN